MSFAWNKINIAHLARHDITPELAEKIFQNALVMPSEQMDDRYVAENIVEGKPYRLVFEILANGKILPVTAFRIKKLRS